MDCRCSSDSFRETERPQRKTRGDFEASVIPACFPSVCVDPSGDVVIQSFLGPAKVR